MIQAEPLEAQLVDWIRRFELGEDLRTLALHAIGTQAAGHRGDQAIRRAELTSQLERLQDLYVMGDLTKSQYVMRRQALQEELERLAPPFDPQLDQAAEILTDFGHFWQVEPSLVERHKLLATLFDRIWQQDGHIVAVKPQQAFAGYFIATTQGGAGR